MKGAYSTTIHTFSEKAMTKAAYEIVLYIERRAVNM
jgi:hypothetical protein